MNKPAWIIGFLFVLTQPALPVGQRVTVPPPGTPLRHELMNALRLPVEKELSQAIIFAVKTLKTSGDWSFGELTPKRKDGQRLTYTHTPYAEAVKAGIFDEGMCVLWYRHKGVWQVKTYVLGATDVPYGCWWKAFNAPKGIFTYTEKCCGD